MPRTMKDELRRIPGVGASIARDLRSLGIERVEDLRGRDPQAMYDRLCELAGQHVDRCMLYVLRCAVYYASEFPHDPRLLQWWSWQDGGVAELTRDTPLRAIRHGGGVGSAALPLRCSA